MPLRPAPLPWPRTEVACAPPTTIMSLPVSVVRPTAALLFLLGTLPPPAATAQPGGVLPPGYILPMDIPLELSGNFMEPRTNHFHAGLDMRTQGREGIAVKAVADGWVSRINISPWGYGKAVYIDHPDGHTTVYAHLQQLRGALAEAALDAQYKARDQKIDVRFPKDALPVQQGQVIALSGNTGGSGGPHLHFEVRRTASQRALDPEVFGMRAPDRTPPEIHGVRLHALNDTSLVGPYPPKALGFATQGAQGRYGLKSGEVPTAYGTVGLAVNTFDRYDNSSFKFGVRHISVEVDSVPVFSVRFDEVDFNQNRYRNAHMEHAMTLAHKRDYHRLYRLPNNPLRIYGREPAQGRIALTPGRDHRVRIVVTDGRDNRSELVFTLRGATAEEAAAWPQPEITGSLFRYDTENTLVEDGVRLTLPAHALYDDAYVAYERRTAPPKAVAPLHRLHHPTTPIHLNSTLWIGVPELEERLRPKALIVSIDEKGKISPHGGTWHQGGVRTEIRAFGDHTVMIDTVPPRITNVDLRADMRGASRFALTITDDLSGIQSWRGSIDGQWVLMEYDPKTATVVHHFDKHTNKPGRHTFELVVTDDRGNRSSWKMEFTR